MKTPKIYSDNLKNGIITKDMLVDCLYSINKRAKNYRDQEYKYRDSYFETKEKYRRNKELSYQQKDTLLKLFSPNCIHREKYSPKTRIYDYDYDYDKYINEGNFIYKNEYYNRDLKEFVEFIDVILPAYRYYLFYDFEKCSFHSPIYEQNLDEYSHLEIKDIRTLITSGKNINELLSCQFVSKVLDLINNGTYELIMD